MPAGFQRAPHDGKPSAHQIPSPRSSASLEQICSHIESYIEHLPKTLRRRTWPLLPDKRLPGPSTQERLGATTWGYKRIMELWAARGLNGAARQSDIFHDNFKECLVQFLQALASLTFADHRHWGSRRDSETQLKMLERALISLHEALQTWSLGAELDELASSGYTGILVEGT